MPLHRFRNIVLTVIHRILCRLDQLCSIASVTTSYIAESPWPVRRKSTSQPTSQRGSKYDHLYSPISKQPKPEMKIDVELAAQLEVRRMEKWRKKSPQVRTPSLGKTTAANSSKFTPPRIPQTVSGGRHGYHTQQRTACKVRYTMSAPSCRFCNIEQSIAV
jgi:hypothetical protein